MTKKIFNVMNAALVACAMTLTTCVEFNDNPVNPDDNGKRFVLTEITWSYSDGAFKQYFYSYDEEGRLTQERMIQEFTDGQQSSDDTTIYSYEDGLITEQRVGEEYPHMLHLNADGLLIDYEYYNYPASQYLHTTYEYDDARHLTTIHNGETSMMTLTWEGDDIVAITAYNDGQVTSTVDVEPSEVTTSGFYQFMRMGSIQQLYFMMGLFGSMPKHMPATIIQTAESVYGSMLTTESYSYTVADGLLTEFTCVTESDIKMGPISQKKTFSVTNELIWKEL